MKQITYRSKLNLNLDYENETAKIKNLPDNIKLIHAETITQIEAILNEPCDNDKTNMSLYGELNEKFGSILVSLDEKLDKLFNFDNPNYNANNKIFGSFIDPTMKIFYFHLDKFCISKSLASYLLKKCEVM